VQNMMVMLDTSSSAVAERRAMLCVRQ